MEDKKEKKMKSVFDDESESSEQEDINQLHVNKEYKERYVCLSSYQLASRNESNVRSWHAPETWALI